MRAGRREPRGAEHKRGGDKAEMRDLTHKGWESLGMTQDIYNDRRTSRMNTRGRELQEWKPQ